MTAAVSEKNGEAAILSRVFRPEHGDFSPVAARALLKLGFDKQDRDRMHELAVKNQKDQLTDDESAELNAYIHVGMVLDLLQAKARRSIMRTAIKR